MKNVIICKSNMHESQITHESTSEICVKYTAQHKTLLFYRIISNMPSPNDTEHELCIIPKLLIGINDMIILASLSNKTALTSHKRKSKVHAPQEQNKSIKFRSLFTNHQEHHARKSKFIY